MNAIDDGTGMIIFVSIFMGLFGLICWKGDDWVSNRRREQWKKDHPDLAKELYK